MYIHKHTENLLEIEDITGTRILVSYITPVAILHPDGLLEVTLKKHSNTTSKQITQWKNKIVFSIEHHKPQEYFNNYLVAL